MWPTAGSRGLSPGLLIAGAVTVLALPSALLAISSRLDMAMPRGGLIASHSVTSRGLANFASGAVDTGLARALAALPSGKGSLFRFTPAGFSARPDRSVTVAVRVDAATVHAVSAIIVRPPPAGKPAPTVPLHLAVNAYNFGLTRGTPGFTLGAPGFALPGDTHGGDAHGKPDLPDLQGFALTEGSTASQPSRISPHIVLGEQNRPGRAPRTLEAAGEQTVDLGGSYRLSRNVDVTAGVRYSQDRDRLQALPDGKQQTQAVFVGTQFHF